MATGVYKISSHFLIVKEYELALEIYSVSVTLGRKFIANASCIKSKSFFSLREKAKTFTFYLAMDIEYKILITSDLFLKICCSLKQFKIFVNIKVVIAQLLLK